MHDCLTVAENVVKLAVGEKITVQVSSLNRNSWIDFNVCDTDSCSKVSAFGAYPDGSLNFLAYVRCNSMAWKCTKHSEVIIKNLDL